MPRSVLFKHIQAGNVEAFKASLPLCNNPMQHQLIKEEALLYYWTKKDLPADSVNKTNALAMIKMMIDHDHTFHIADNNVYAYAGADFSLDLSEPHNRALSELLTKNQTLTEAKTTEVRVTLKSTRKQQAFKFTGVLCHQLYREINALHTTLNGTNIALTVAQLGEIRAVLAATLEELTKLKDADLEQTERDLDPYDLSTTLIKCTSNTELAPVGCSFLRGRPTARRLSSIEFTSQVTRSIQDTAAFITERFTALGKQQKQDIINVLQQGLDKINDEGLTIRLRDSNAASLLSSLALSAPPPRLSTPSTPAVPVPATPRTPRRVVVERMSSSSSSDTRSTDDEDAGTQEEPETVVVDNPYHRLRRGR